MNSKIIWSYILLIIFTLHHTEGQRDHIEGERLFFGGRRYNDFLKTPRPIINKYIPDEYFEQKLDHYNPTDDTTWQQRFWTNDDFYVTGGPVFLRIGGESAAGVGWMFGGNWIYNADRYHALCFQLEHRFYGMSRPTESRSTESLLYLSSEQALADLANFIENMTVTYELPPNTKWILFGCSYSGCLAAWMRAKYPHLVHGAVSGSSPLLAKADFSEYFRVVLDDLSSYNLSCVTSLREANWQLQALLKTPVGQQTVNIIFKLCDPIDVYESNDVSGLFDVLAQNLGGVAQYNDESWAERNSAVNLKAICDVMVNESIGTSVHRYAAVTNMILESHSQKCLDYKYRKMINFMQLEDWIYDHGSGARQWFYQTCTEFGYYQSTSLTSDVFGDEFTVNFLIQQCVDIFGPRFIKEQVIQGIRRTNMMYGGLNQQASRIVYVHGSVDPWHALGIIKTVHRVSPAIYIHGTSHCAHTVTPSPHDLPQMKFARHMISDLIGLWLDED